MKLIKLSEILNLHRIILRSSATGTLQLKPFRNGNQKKTKCPKWNKQKMVLRFPLSIELCRKLRMNRAIAFFFSMFLCFIIFTMPRDKHISLSNKGAIVVVHDKGKTHRKISFKLRGSKRSRRRSGTISPQIIYNPSINPS